MATFRYESDLKGHDRRRFENVTGKAQKKIESKNCITRHIERLRRKNPLESICYQGYIDICKNSIDVAFSSTSFRK